MSLTELAKERRRKYLTASDVPAIMGLSTFKTPLAVYADKTGQGEPFEGNEATQLGDDFETALIERAARIHRIEGVRKNQWRVSEGGILAATLDAVGRSVGATSEVAIEAKTSGIIHPSKELPLWGESGGPHVPDRVNIQVQVQMLCAEIDVAIVSALLGGGLGYRHYTVPRDETSIKYIVDYCEAWWERHIVKGNPPPVTSGEDSGVLRWFKRVAGKSTPIDAALVRNVLAARETVKQAEEVKDRAEAELKLALGDAEVGLADDATVKYLEENAGARVDTAALRASYPEVYALVAKPSTRKILRIKTS